MLVGRTCLCCGRRYVGDVRRAYCSTRCRDAAKYHRRRLRALDAMIEHAKRQREVARVAGDLDAYSYQNWRLQQLAEERYLRSWRGAHSGAHSGATPMSCDGDDALH